MLVLTRRKNEGVVLSDARTGEVYGRVVVCKSDDFKMKLGFICTPSLVLTRDEIAAEVLNVSEDEIRKFQTPRGM